MPKISVLIPAYNVEKYIARCLDSVIGQTFTDIEIIIVNDGSTDGTASIIDEYATRDSRIRVIVHPKNCGLMWVRKTCIEASTGDYLMIVDSDDRIKLDACELLYSAAVNSGADLVVAGYEVCYSDGRKVYKANKLEYGNDTRGVVRAMLEDELKRYEWAKLYARRLLVDNPPEYLKHFNLCEDEIISYNMAFNVRKAVSISDVVYEYNQIDGSLTHNDNPKLFRDMMFAKSVVRNLCYRIDEEIGELADVNILKSIHWMIKSRGGSNRRVMVRSVDDFGFSSILSFPALVRLLGFKKGLNYYLVTHFKFGSWLVNLYDNA